MMLKNETMKNNNFNTISITSTHPQIQSNSNTGSTYNSNTPSQSP